MSGCVPSSFRADTPARHSRLTKEWTEPDRQQETVLWNSALCSAGPRASLLLPVKSGGACGGAVRVRRPHEPALAAGSSPPGRVKGAASILRLWLPGGGVDIGRNVLYSAVSLPNRGEVVRGWCLRDESVHRPPRGCWALPRKAGSACGPPHELRAFALSSLLRRQAGRGGESAGKLLEIPLSLHSPVSAADTNSCLMPSGPNAPKLLASPESQSPGRPVPWKIGCFKAAPWIWRRTHWDMVAPPPTTKE